MAFFLLFVSEVMGLAGQARSFGEDWSYKFYALNSFDNTGFSPSGIRGGRQKGSKALAEHIALTGRLDWTPLDGLLVGASFWTGNTGQNQSLEGVNVPDASLDTFIRTLPQ